MTDPAQRAQLVRERKICIKSYMTVTHIAAMKFNPKQSLAMFNLHIHILKMLLATLEVLTADCLVEWIIQALCPHIRASFSTH